MWRLPTGGGERRTLMSHWATRTMRPMPHRVRRRFA